VFAVEAKLDYLPIDEEHPTLPDEPYGLSKLFVAHCVTSIDLDLTSVITQHL
jgi:UDP-glucose 4-epimerase